MGSVICFWGEKKPLGEHPCSWVCALVTRWLPASANCISACRWRFSEKQEPYDSSVTALRWTQWLSCLTCHNQQWALTAPYAPRGKYEWSTNEDGNPVRFDLKNYSIHRPFRTMALSVGFPFIWPSAQWILLLSSILFAMVVYISNWLCSPSSCTFSCRGCLGVLGLCFSAKSLDGCAFFCHGVYQLLSSCFESKLVCFAISRKHCLC